LSGLKGDLWDIVPGHGEYLTGLILGLVLVIFLKRWREQNASWFGSLLLGLGTGAAFYVQPALLPVILGCMLFELWWMKNPRKWVYTGMMGLGMLIACLPWGLRNYMTFDAIFFIRSNFGLELRMGNNNNAAATFDEMNAKNVHYIHPRADSLEALKVLEMGEYEYMQQAMGKAIEWIGAHPTEFLRLFALRFLNLWAGPLYRSLDNSIGVLLLTVLALVGLWLSFPKISIPQRAALLIPLITYPMVYYIVAYMPRYRIPIDWILYILFGAAVWQLAGGSMGTGREVSD
jgi:hypothetical protein